MSIGDLVYIRHKIHDDDDYIGLVLSKERIGSGRKGSTVLYDILLTEMEDVITISDIYFEIWKIE